MITSKKDEAEALQVYMAFMDCYLNGDVKNYPTFFDADFHFVGTVTEEEFLTKKEATAFYEATAEQFAGKLELRNRNISTEPIEELVLIGERCDGYFLADGEWTFYSRFRMSTLLQKKHEQWKFIHQHISMPDLRAEQGETIAIDQIKTENIQLREAVKRRTIELEHKTRELEIESSLEKVRTVAMSMRKPDDMLEVCQMISDQLKILGISEIRNVQTAIVEGREDGHYMNYQYFQQYDKRIIEDVEIGKHPNVRAMIDRMQQSPDAFFSHSFTGSALEEWKQYRKDDHQFLDPILDSASAVHFYFYSIGQGGLGLSVYFPLSDENIIVFHRFRNVFALAYQRFRDIEQAEAQAREAQIELALERVRARTMAMQRSEELSETAHLLFQQFTELGESPLQITIGIVHEEEGFIEFRVTDWAGGGLQVNRGFNASIAEPTLIHKVFTAWKEQQKSLVVDLSGKELEAWIHYRNAISGVQVSSTDTKGRRVITCAFYSKGHISFSSPEPRPKESIQLLERFAGVFDQTYTRFLDLQKAEAQAREAKIEASLERVRSRTMGMQQSHELGDVAIVLFKELNQLVENLWTCGFVLCEKDRGEDEWWLSTGDGFIPAFYLPNTVDPTHANIYAAWKKGETYHTEQLEGEALQEHYDWLMNIPVSKNIFDEMKAAGHSLPAWQKLHCAYFSYGYLVMITQVPCPEEQLFKRFALVFDQTYTRFLDLQKAEAQAREAQIEASLERVRTRSMGMQKSKELKEVIQVVFEQFIHLKINIEHTGFVMDYKERDDYDIWVADPLGVPSQVTIPYFDCIYYNQFNDAKERGIDFFATHLTFEEKNTFYQKLFEYVPGLPEEAKRFYFSCPGLAASTVLLDNIGLYIENFSGIPFTADENATLMRFGKVFQQTYTRFLDLQKAEAQAREAMIETALEKVRSRTMAMQHSDELQDAAIVLFQQIKSLDVETGSCGFNIWDKDKNSATVWMSSPEGGLQEPFKLMHTESEIYKEVMEAWRSRKNILIKEVSGEALKKHFDYLLTLPGIGTVIKELRNTNYSFPERMIYHFAFFHQGYLSFHLHASRPETHDIFKRFANVFEQTYTRFLDLQKAEAQAREARIEASLERVRSKAMAMHSSEDLAGTIGVFYRELKLLSETPIRCGVTLIDKETRNAEVTTMNTTEQDDSIEIVGNIKMAGHKVLEEVYDHWLIQKEYHAVLRGNEIKDYYEVMKPQISFPEYPNDEIQFGYYFMFNEGDIYAWTKKELGEDDLQIYRKFTNVISLTYKRYKDLIQAEDNAREAQIEAGLERVRSRTLAMHKSDELADTAAVVFRQLIGLGIAPNRLYIAIIHDDSGELEFWITDEDGTKVSTRFMGHKDRNDSVRKMYEGWQGKKKSITISMEGKELQQYFHYLSDELHVPFRQGLSQKKRVQTIAYFSKGFIGIASPDDQPEETSRLLERFAAVFNLTYTRFNDLQHAEAQTEKAKIEVALERVRARALAMQEPEELVEVAQVMRHEMGLLGVEELETSSIYIHDDGADIADCWYAIKDIRIPEKKLVADHITMELHKTWVGREMLEFYNSSQQQTSIVMQGAHRIEWIKYCSGISDVLEDFYGEVIPNRTYHLYKFSNGAIGAAAEGDISEESWELLRRATSVFSLAYSRFKDLTQARVDLQKLKTEKQRAEDALAHLKAAQTQLIQSEKMASLGELTAGIAHEIQNPLNFVNNFSDVNTELIEEMKEELQLGNNTEAIAIANDIADNEQKINHHGKRADAIVKGMLQHSRTSSSVKEPTDINALADEYLRLAYHGLRAKDKSFNATMKTDFDASIGMINVIPQDIGRVILNLITNAFYAVSEKKKSIDSFTPQPPEGGLFYEPMVMVSTKRIRSPLGDLGVNVSVSDNGPGIPKNAMDKIFQPFFTTKPTGQGTGLGLSLSYDIVKAHSGELKVETQEGEGSVFTIQLPVS